MQIVVILKLLLILIVPSSTEDCQYTCNSNGGCRVQYVGPPRAGRLSGKP